MFYDEKDNYEIPSTSNYMKFEDGENKFRILGSFAEKTAIQGIAYWKTIGDKRTPIRLPKKADGSVPAIPMSELEINKFGNMDLPKYFWALPVWNYQEKKVQILEITQKQILTSIKSYIGNKKWGDPRDYDIIVTRGKEGEKTVYTTTVDPKEELEAMVLEAYSATKINIKALFEGKDPFEVQEDVASDAVAASL